MKNKKTVIGVIIAGVILVLVFILSRGEALINKNDISQVTINSGVGQITVDRSGRVDYLKDGNSYTDYWSGDKTNAFFAYFDKYYLGADPDLLRAGDNAVTIAVNGENKTYILGDDEEIDDAAAEDAQTPDDDTGGGGGGIGDYFTSSPSGTPTPGSAPTLAPTPPNGGDPECLYWRLSYCVRKKTPSPTPTPVGTAEIRPDNCEDNLQTGRTVISNELCLPTPTPTP